ncbi:unnamed protein product [Timema podura]|uniref:p53 DNA-binding domain-containing protein n=1 Tax=Timema podura TaxID=61482 RepID=A0ABN7NVC5_TIMPD|nr:unnamed protein product [Timema podura]
MDKSVPVQVKLESYMPGLFLRALLVFVRDDDLKDSVRRCFIHVALDNPSNKGYENILDHVIRCEDPASVYDFNTTSGRYSVVVPVRSPSSGSDTVTMLYSFTCKTSCMGGMNRRPTEVIFTLEYEDDALLISACLDVVCELRHVKVFLNLVFFFCGHPTCVIPTTSACDSSLAMKPTPFLFPSSFPIQCSVKSFLTSLMPLPFHLVSDIQSSLVHQIHNLFHSSTAQWLAATSLNVRVCSCPKRDCAKEEKDLARAAERGDTPEKSSKRIAATNTTRLATKRKNETDTDTIQLVCAAKHAKMLAGMLHAFHKFADDIKPETKTLVMSQLEGIM